MKKQGKFKYIKTSKLLIPNSMKNIRTIAKHIPMTHRKYTNLLKSKNLKQAQRLLRNAMKGQRINRDKKTKGIFIPSKVRVYIKDVKIPWNIKPRDLIKNSEYMDFLWEKGIFDMDLKSFDYVNANSPLEQLSYSLNALGIDMSEWNTDDYVELITAIKKG